MAKLTAWLMALVGVLWLLDVADLWGTVTAETSGWLVGLAFLVIGITKLMRNYGSKRR